MELNQPPGQQRAPEPRQSPEQIARAELQRNLVDVGMGAVRRLDERTKAVSEEDREFAGTMENGVRTFERVKESMPYREQERIEGLVRLRRVNETVEGIKRDAAFLGQGTAELVPEAERLFREALAAPTREAAEAKLVEVKARFGDKVRLAQMVKSYQVERGDVIARDVSDNDEEIQHAHRGIAERKAEDAREKSRDGEQAQSYPDIGPMVAASREFQAGVSNAVGKLKDGGRKFYEDTSSELGTFNNAVDGLATTLQSPKNPEPPQNS